MMSKKIALLIFLIVSICTYSQTENSLLWKISGNGLKKDSYLYGTMHVSQKIAFHLDDVFYEALLKSDFVGLETDPSWWLDYLFNSPNELNYYRGLGYANLSNFYNTPFKFVEPKQKEIMFYLSREDMLLNGILYRTNQMMQNFQEETYLDMFIFQTGKKHGKKIFSLEDYEESSILVKKATSASNFIKKEPAIWLRKKLKDDNYISLLNNAYRDRKIHFLDSINQGLYNENYMKNMLYIRNANMVNSIDSIAKNGSLFSAVGAAHLGGDKGVIAMLRNKGYTVEPLYSEITKKAETAKKQIEDKLINVNFTSQTSDDGYFTAQFPNKIYELNILNNTSYLSPDLSNGGYVIVTRMNTFSKIYNKEIKDKNFDKLLIESIPGEIITKKEIEKCGIKGLDILNKTKSGDFQRYQIFFTPLEVLIFKMHGNNNYVKIYGDTFFDSLKFNNLDDSFTTVSPTNKGFQVDVPNNHTFTNKSNFGNRIIQAVDKKDNYYFLKEVVLNDISYIEEDAFELERIQERFCKNLELEYKKGSFTQDNSAFESNTTLKDKSKNLFLKTVTNGSRYYLLGYVTSDTEKNNRFFDSFKITSIEYPTSPFEKKVDTSLYFSVHTNVDPVNNNMFRYARRKKKPYQSFQKSANYTNKANEKIFVKLNKLNDLLSYDNLDSLWKYQTYNPSKYKFLSDNLNLGSYYSSKKFLKKNIKQGIDKNGYQFYDYYLKDSTSSKAVKVKKILVEGAIYELKTLVDTTYKESKFVTEFYKTFTPKDTILGKSLFKDKTDQFFQALKNRDSLALDSYYSVNFKNEHTNKLLNILKTFKFDENQLEIKEHLIRQLSKIKTKKVTRFLDNLYLRSFNNPSNQIAIIKSILNEKTSESYQRFLKLLELDVPLSSESYKMNSLFNPLSDSLNISKNLFPEILNYATIEEYKEPIYEVLRDLVDKKLMKGSDYTSFKNQILNQARIELKRQLSKNSEENIYSQNTDNANLLDVYVKLLFPFRKDKKVKTFFENVEFVKNNNVKSTLLAAQIEVNEKYNKEIFEELVAEVTSRGVFYGKLQKINKASLFPVKFKAKEEIYKSILFKRSRKKELKDSIVFLDKRDFKVSEKSYEAYFYKSKVNEKDFRAYDKEWKLNYIIVKKNDDKISLKPVKKRKDQNLDITADIKDIIDDIVEENKLKNRKRVNLNTGNNSNYNYGLF